MTSRPTTPLEQAVLRSAMRLASHWPDDLSYFKGNHGALLRLLRACKRLKKARNK